MVQTITTLDPLALAAAVLLAVVATGRITRLWIYDKWPPVAWLRERFLEWAEQTRHTPALPATPTSQVPLAGYEDLTWRAGWVPLVKCPFCVAPYFALASVAWALASGLDTVHFWGVAWWTGHAWLTVSYLAAMLVVRDEPADD